MLSPERIAEIKARIDAAPENLDSRTRFVFRMFDKLRNPESLGVLLDGDGSDDWAVSDIWANSSRDIRDLLADLETLRAQYSSAAVTHALYHALVGPIETHMGLDPCPATKLAAEIARAVVDQLPELGMELQEFAAFDLEQLQRSISPSRVGVKSNAYFCEVASRMRKKELEIKMLAKVSGDDD